MTIALCRRAKYRLQLGKNLLAKTKDGREFSVETMLSSVQDGIEFAIIATIQDASERHYFEHNVARYFLDIPAISSNGFSSHWT